MITEALAGATIMLVGVIVGWTMNNTAYKYGRSQGKNDQN